MEVRRNATRPTKFDFKKPDRWGGSNIEFSGGGAAMDYIGSTYANALGNHGALSCLIVQRKAPSQSLSFWLHLPLHLQECFRYLGYSEADLPESERAAHETLALPIYPELAPEQQEYVVGCIADFFK